MATTTVGKGNFSSQESVKAEKQLDFPNSLGLLYSTITTYLGFSANNSEYKVMGLAAYGKVSNKYLKKFNKLIKSKKDGSYVLDESYFDFISDKRMYTQKLIDLFELEPRGKDAEIKKEHEDLAATLQYKLEEVVFNLLNSVYREHQIDALCLSGGVALNSVMNAKILANTPFKKLFIPPDPSDAGGSMGAALYVAKKFDQLDQEKLGDNFSPYLGPEYPYYQIKKILETHPQKDLFSMSFFSSSKELIKSVVNYLDQDKVIAWFQGKMEWGPRALGNRSILASARKKEMQDIINAKVKKRELFRPFAQSS